MSQYRGELLGSEVVINLKLTKAWYRKSEVWGCDCGYCRNFLALAKERLLPRPVMDLLEKFEVAPEKATYVCEQYRNEQGHLYELSYRVAGRIIGEEQEVEYPWGTGSCGHNPYPYGAPGFPSPHFDLEFFVTLPWMLDEPDQ